MNSKAWRFDYTFAYKSDDTYHPIRQRVWKGLEESILRASPELYKADLFVYMRNRIINKDEKRTC